MTRTTDLQPPVGAGGFESIEFQPLARLGRPHAGTAQTSMLQHGRPQKLLRGATWRIQQNPTKFRSRSCTGTEPDRVRSKIGQIRQPAAVAVPRSAACASLDLMGRATGASIVSLQEQYRGASEHVGDHHDKYDGVAR